MRKTFGNKHDAQARASQQLPRDQEISSGDHVHETPSSIVAVHINGKLIKSTELKQPDAEALIQMVMAEQ